MTNPHRARSITTAVVAATVAILLSAGSLALALINPYTLIGLAPVLLAVAAVVRAVTGTRY